LTIETVVLKVEIDQGTDGYSSLPKIQLIYGTLEGLLVELKTLIAEKLYLDGSITITKETIR
jgi:hypothetical protein